MACEEEEVKAVVMDIGSGTTKCGIAGDDAPAWIKPSLVDGKRVMERGVATTVELMERMMHQSFHNGIKVAPEEHPLLFLEPPLRDKQSREQITQIAFERMLSDDQIASNRHSLMSASSFNCPAFYLGMSDSLALSASGRTTGIIAGLGYGITTVTTIWEGYSLAYITGHRQSRQATFVAEHGMKDSIMHVKRVLERRGHSFESDERAIECIADFVAKKCSVSMRFEQESRELKHKEEVLKSFNSFHAVVTRQRPLELPPELIHRIRQFATSGLKSYALPDGQTVEVGEESVLCGESLFQPSLFAPTAKPLHLMLFEPSVHVQQLMDDDWLRDNLRQNIVIHGGNSMYPGLVDRLSWELRQLAPDPSKIKVIAPPERQYMAWIGGSIIATLSTFQQMWISREEYDERRIDETEEEVKAVVMDIGSGTTKCGIAGDDAPAWIKPSLVDGRRVIERGVPESRDLLEEMLRRAICVGLEVDPTEISLLLAEPLLNPKPWRETTTEIVFEKFSVSGFYLAVANALALYASSGSSTGLVADLGFGITTIAPIYQDSVLPLYSVKKDYGMQEVIDHTKYAIQRNQRSSDSLDLSTPASAEMLSKVGTVSNDFDTDMRGYRVHRNSLDALSKSLEDRVPTEVVEHIGRFATHGLAAEYVPHPFSWLI